MTAAICFACGATKSGPFGACQACQRAPELKNELALSLVLSEHFASKGELVHFAREIGDKGQVLPPDELLSKARKALEDPQLGAMLNLDLAAFGQPPSNSHRAKESPSRADALAVCIKPRVAAQTYLHRNPFYVLGLTTRDDRRTIVERAEERSLESDYEACQKARSDLTNPRARLSAEMSWLPGVSPTRAVDLVERIVQSPTSVRKETGIPPFAQANLFAAAFSRADAFDSVEDLAGFIRDFAARVEDLSEADIQRDINEDRSISGFPPVTEDQVATELLERKRQFRDAISEALDKLPTHSLIEAMTLAVDWSTNGGEGQAPELIDELVDSYDVKIQAFLEREGENARILVDAIEHAASEGRESRVQHLISQLEGVVLNWDKVAQPSQLSKKSRGLDHEPSVELAYRIRDLAITLYNEHEMLVQAKRLTDLLQKVFAEVPEVSERVERDADALEKIFRQREKAEAAKSEWEREITYSADIGGIFSKVLAISPAGISWRGKSYPLESITHVRWGGIRRSVNGISTGTTYTIAFGDKWSEVVVRLQRDDVFIKFIDKLWHAVGIRLLTELLEALRAGAALPFGEAIVRDEEVTLKRRRLFRADEPVRCSWRQVQVWVSGGSFYIGSKEDKKTYAGLSYIDTPNGHILEQAIRMAFKRPGMRRLSDLLQDDP